MIDVTINSERKKWTLPVLLLLVALTGGVFAFPPSYFFNSNVLIGLCLFPFSFLITGPKRNNFLYASLIVLFATLAVVYSVRIFYFFTLAFYVLWVIELLAGRLNALILFLIVFMSPFFIQVVTILGFPIRLMLSDCAGTILNFVGVNVQVQGNMVIRVGAMFSVDEACMGLNMLAISMLMGVFVLAFRYRVSGTSLGLYATLFFFMMAFVLNMITNLIRIIVLVYFRIPPENAMHGFVGILCLIVYVVVPLHFLSAWLVRRYGKPKNDKISQQESSRSSIILMVILPLAVFFTGIAIEGRPAWEAGHADVHFEGAKPERLNDGITKIVTNDLLIYVKTIPEFFTGEHTPLMCWRGSGYEFVGIETATVAAVSIYKGTLVKDGKVLHTAWWYSNGEIKTISQLDWRMRMLKGEADFCLVNVTAEEEQTLMQVINTMFTTNPLTIKH